MRPSSRSGLVLVVVMGLLVALTILAAATTQAQRTHLRLAAHHAQRTSAAVAAEAGLERAVALAGLWAAGRKPQAAHLEQDLGEATSRLLLPDGTETRPGLRNEDAVINLNTASMEVLARLPGVDAPAAERLVEARRRLNRAAGRIDPVDLPELRSPLPPAGLVEEPFPDAATLVRAVPSWGPLLGSPRILSRVTWRSSGRLDVSSADAPVLEALGIEAMAAKELMGRAWASQAEFLAAAGLPSDAWHRRHIAVHPAAWRVLSVGTHGGVVVVAEGVVVRTADRLVLADAHRRDAVPGEPVRWLLP